MSRRRLICVASLAASLVCSGAGRAETLSWVSPEIVTVNFLTGPHPSPDEFWAALRIKLAPGWVTYWKSPGRYGFKPKFDWKGSRNLVDADVLWPAPHRENLPEMDADTAVYAGEVVLPIRLRAADKQSAIGVNLVLDFGVCSTICIPEHVVFVTAVGPDAHGNRDEARLIETAKSNLPRANGSSGLTISAARLRRDGHLAINVSTPDVRKTDLFVGGSLGDCLRRPTVEPNGGTGVVFDFGVRCKIPVPSILTVVAVSDLASISAQVSVSQGH